MGTVCGVGRRCCGVVGIASAGAVRSAVRVAVMMCENNGIKPSMYDQVTIEFDESMFFDRVLGNMTRIDDYQENETNLIVVKTGRVKEVLGGISSSPLSNNNVPNIII